jgi:photosystem II stability/assembly factor-like uncharacterized protein
VLRGSDRRPAPARSPGWVIIGRLVSLPSRRLAATLVALTGLIFASLVGSAAALPDSTWVGLAPLPQQGRTAVFALAVAPDNNQVVIAGNSQGTILRSKDGGSTWAPVHSGRASLLTITFSPFDPAIVLAGTRGNGALASRDGGVTWSVATGLEGRQVRVFGFALTLVAAGTDTGVYVSQDGFSWTASGLKDNSISALAIGAIHPPVRIFAGGDSAVTGATVPMFQSIDSGATWSQMNPGITGTVVSRLAAGPLPPTGDVRPLVVGTNAGLFASADNGANFIPLSGGKLLPSTDYTQLAFVTNHYDHLYTASDGGGGSRSGGLWFTGDAGLSFKSLAPPLTSITALAVSNDEAPTLYVATFRAVDHSVALWAFHDTGGPPQGPQTATTPSASGARTSSPAPNPFDGIVRVVFSSQAPYIALGLVAVVVLGLAVVSHFRSRVR